MYGRAFHPASPQLPGQVLIASTTGSGLSPNTHRYRSISNNAGRSPKPMGRGGLLTNVALSCSVKNFYHTRSAMSYLPKQVDFRLSSPMLGEASKLAPGTRSFAANRISPQGHPRLSRESLRVLYNEGRRPFKVQCSKFKDLP